MFQEQFSDVELSETDGVFNLSISSVCHVGGSRAGVADSLSDRASEGFVQVQPSGSAQTANIFENNSSGGSGGDLARFDRQWAADKHKR